MLFKKRFLVLSFFIVNSLISMQNPDSREKIVHDRVLLQCTLGALESKHDPLFESFQIDTPETRAATLEQLRMLLRNEAQSLANPTLLRKNPESDIPVKLNYTIKGHFTRAKINEALLAKWSREHGNLTHISFKQLSDLVSSRLR